MLRDLSIQDALITYGLKQDKICLVLLYKDIYINKLCEQFDLEVGTQVWIKKLELEKSKIKRLFAFCCKTIFTVRMELHDLSLFYGQKLSDKLKYFLYVF